MSVSAEHRELLTQGLQRPHVLRDYALLADGERGILVGPRGDFAWMCFPHWDSAALFSSLIGGSGTYTVTPTGRFVWGGYYEPRSLIWHSRWVTDDGGIVESREALGLPSSPDRAVILRRVTARQGPARVRVVLNPRGGFGSEPLRRLHVEDDGTWSGHVGDTQLLWTGGENAAVCPDGHGGKALECSLELEPGDHHDFVLSFARGDEPAPAADAAWHDTEAAWLERVPAFAETIAPRSTPTRCLPD
jgi:hypothetical protein